MSPPDLAPRSLQIALGRVEEIVPTADDEFIVTVLTRPTAMSVFRFRNGEQELVGSTPSLFPYHVGASVFRSDRGWWFSRHGDEQLASAVFFVAGDGAARTTRVRVPYSASKVWLPLPVDEPRGVYVRIEDDGTLAMEDVTAAGMKPLARFHGWNIDRTLLTSQWAAAMVGAGPVAVVTTDRPNGPPALTLFMIGEGTATEAMLPCSPAIAYPLDIATDGAGSIAIVGVSGAGEVVATIVPVAAAESARCVVISDAGEVAVRPPGGSPDVTWTGRSFVAAWISADGTIRARALGTSGPAADVIDIGEGADVDRPLQQLVHNRAESLMFIWKERDGGFVERSVPKELSGYAFATKLWRVLASRVSDQPPKAALERILSGD